jgi:pSer/pThr/pTyr-binding forkhead associated (FHA) protein
MEGAVAICKSCGRDNQSLYKFCLGCGSELSSGDEPSPPAPAASATGKSSDTTGQPADLPDIDDPGTTHRDEIIAGLEASSELGLDMPKASEPSIEVEPGIEIEHTRVGHANGEAHNPLVASLAGSGTAPAHSNMRPCPQCGTPVPLEFTFCGQCGGRVEPRPASTTASTAVIGRVGVQSASRGRLILIRPDGSEGGTHPLHEGENLIGRGLGPLFDADGYLSPRHAQLVLNAAGLVIRDLGSLNGIYVKLTEEVPLSDGDIFRIGQELLRFDEIPAPVPLEDGTDVLGSPNPGYWGRLALIIGRDQDGSAFPLFGDAVLLGRERGDILFPEDGYVSGQHARVSLRNDGYWLADLNSSNGTFVRVRGERAVPSGASILLGQQLFRVVYP